VSFYFDFDNDFFSVHTTGALTALAAHVKNTSATRVTVTGYRGATRLSNGTLMTERAGIATERATKVRDTLVGLGVAPTVVTAAGREQPEAADGVNDPWRRRVVVNVR
jgi:outer membrane protein OmpA-like peptidoglycan-associated protein